MDWDSLACRIFGHGKNLSKTGAMTWLCLRCDRQVHEKFIEKAGRRFERERFWREFRSGQPDASRKAAAPAARREPSA